MVAGYGESGKGEFSRLLAMHSCGRAMSSSEAAARFVFSLMRAESYPSPSHQAPNAFAAWEDRRKHRAYWKRAIERMTEKNPAALADIIFETHRATIYDGIRSRREYFGIVAEYSPLVIWVARPGIEADEGNEICEGACHITITNDGDLRDLSRKAAALAKLLKGARL